MNTHRQTLFSQESVSSRQLSQSETIQVSAIDGAYIDIATVLSDLNECWAYSITKINLT